MNTSRVKLMTWTLSALLGVGMSLYVGSFLTNKAEIEKSVDTADMKEKLDNVPAPVAKVDHMISLDEVYASLRDHNWSGKAAPPPPRRRGTEPEPPPRNIAVADLVEVLMIKADTTDPKSSNCVLLYTPQSKVQLPGGNTVVKFVGDRLDGDHSHVRIAAISGQAVEFAFDKDGRTHEFLEPGEFPQSTLIGRADGTTALPRPGPRAFPRSSKRSRIQNTVRLAPNRYLVGSNDAEYLDLHYDEILSQVRTRRWRDPVTGKYAGVQLSEVPQGSFAAKHGAQEGDIIKSINAHPVTSPQEAITFAKNNANQYTKWEIEIENKGRTRFVTYIPPKK